MLYSEQGRWEEAAGFYQQAIDIAVCSGDRAGEGRHRYNLANMLLRSGRYDQARTELHSAIDCNKPYGHTAESWNIWAVLEQVEHTTGHPDAARAARDNAVSTYLAYRHAGGANRNNAAPLFNAVARAITERTTDQASRELAALLKPDTPPRYTALIAILQALLAGDPEPAHTDHADLDPLDIAELHLLLNTPDP